MKTTLIGDKGYIVITYYRDEDDKLHADHDIWSTAESAKGWYDLRIKKVGKVYHAENWTGVIDSVFIFQSQLCRLEE